MSGLPWWRLLVAAALLVAAGGAAAQSAADAARQLDPNAQRERALQQQRYFDEQAHPQTAPSKKPVIIGKPMGGAGKLPESAVTFTLKDIHFNQSAFIDSATLQRIAAGYVGHPIGFADLNAMVGKINAIYAKRGIVSARAIVPPQTIDNGVLDVRLVEGRLEKLEIDGAKATRRFFLDNRLPLAPGAVVDVPALRDALNWLNRTTELRLQAALRAGEEPGGTDVVLGVTEPPRFNGQVFADNAGDESTGRFRAGALMQVYAPLGIDDRFTLYGVDSRGSFNGLVSYRLPFNRLGGTLELSYSRGDIDIVDGAYESYDITGGSSSYGLTVTQPFLRGNHFWLDGYSGVSWITSNTDIAGEALSDFHVTRPSIGVQLRGFGNRFIWSLSQGISHADSEDIAGETVSLNVFDGNASLLYATTDRISMQLLGAWQYTSKEAVPSPLLFQVGGIGSVRGYSEGVVSGARGYYLNFETRYQWRDGLAPFVFIDHGLVHDSGADGDSLTSAGVGLRWQCGKHLSASIAWGQALEHVVPHQDRGRLHARVSITWPGA